MFYLMPNLSENASGFSMKRCWACQILRCGLLWRLTLLRHWSVLCCCLCTRDIVFSDYLVYHTCKSSISSTASATSILKHSERTTGWKEIICTEILMCINFWNKWWSGWKGWRLTVILKKKFWKVLLWEVIWKVWKSIGVHLLG